MDFLCSHSNECLHSESTRPHTAPRYIAARVLSKIGRIEAVSLSSALNVARTILTPPSNSGCIALVTPSALKCAKCCTRAARAIIGIPGAIRLASTNANSITAGSGIANAKHRARSICAACKISGRVTSPQNASIPSRRRSDTTA